MYKITPHIIAIITLGSSFFFNNNGTYQIHCSTQITQNPIYIILSNMNPNSKIAPFYL